MALTVLRRTGQGWSKAPRLSLSAGILIMSSEPQALYFEENTTELKYPYIREQVTTVCLTSGYVTD